MRLPIIMSCLLAGALSACAADETSAPTPITADASIVAPGYSVPVLLPVLSTAGPSRANAINADGVIVGQSWSGQPGHYTHAVRWNGTSTVVDLGTLPGHVLSAAYGVNIWMVAVGISCTPGFSCQAMRHHSQIGMQLLPSPSGGATAAAINDPGVAVGYTLHPDTARALKWTSNTGYIDITPAGYHARAFDIDNAGVIVGEVTTGTLRYPYRWAASGGGQIIGPAGYRAVAIASNGAILLRHVEGNAHRIRTASGTVVNITPQTGASVTDLSASLRVTGTLDSTAVNWKSAAWGDMPKGTLATTSATALNDCGIVAGAGRATLAANEIPVKWVRRACD